MPIFGRFMTKVYADPSTGITEKDQFTRPAGATGFDCSDAVLPQEVNVNSRDDGAEDFFN